MLRLFYREFILLFIILFAVQVFSKETRKIVAVVDTGIPYNKDLLPYLCKGLQYDITGTGIMDNHGHGTNIIGLIAKGMNTKTHCIAMIKWWDSHLESVQYNAAHGYEARIKAYMKILVDLKPTIANLSLAGNYYSRSEYAGIKLLLINGTKVVVAAGNDRLDLSKQCDSFPACYRIYSKNFYVVGATGTEQTNYGGPVTNMLPGASQCGIFGVCMTGTSQSCANQTAKLLQENN
jgi:hypothetical protein